MVGGLDYTVAESESNRFGPERTPIAPWEPDSRVATRSAFAEGRIRSRDHRFVATVGGRLDHRPVLGRILRPAEVIGEHAVEVGEPIGERRLDRLCHLRVQLLAFLQQDRLVDRFLDEGVLERVLEVGIAPQLERQLNCFAFAAAHGDRLIPVFPAVAIRTVMHTPAIALLQPGNVRKLVDNPDGQLRQGMFMTVSLQGEVSPTLLVPEEALVPERGKAYVFVVRDDVVERREVRTGKRKPGYVEIVDGVREHERVVVDGTQHVRDGSTVEETHGGAS